jgi:hypothetical protein
MTDDQVDDMNFSLGVALFLLIVVLAIALTSCAASHVTAQVPGCPGASVDVPKGCYTQKVEGGVQVRCPGVNSTYLCRH